MKKRIIIIDDETEYTFLLSEIFSSTGKYETRIENRGDRAIGGIREYKPHLILLDIIMPDKDGISIAKELMYDKKINKIPIVFVSAISPESESDQNKEVINKYTFLSKPIKIKELLQVVDDILPEGIDV